MKFDGDLFGIGNEGICGDGKCEGDENCSNCEKDCGKCPQATGTCASDSECETGKICKDEKCVPEQGDKIPCTEDQTCSRLTPPAYCDDDGFCKTGERLIVCGDGICEIKNGEHFKCVGGALEKCNEPTTYCSSGKCVWCLSDGNCGAGMECVGETCKQKQKTEAEKIEEAVSKASIVLSGNEIRIENLGDLSGHDYKLIGEICTGGLFRSRCDPITILHNKEGVTYTKAIGDTNKCKNLKLMVDGMLYKEFPKNKEIECS